MLKEQPWLVTLSSHLVSVNGNRVIHFLCYDVKLWLWLGVANGVGIVEGAGLQLPSARIKMWVRRACELCTPKG